MNVTVSHETVYEYERPISASFMKAYLRPVTDTFQTCHEYSLLVDPPCSVIEDKDHFGNTVLSFEIPSPHNQLVVRAQSRVETHRDAFTTHAPVSEDEGCQAHRDYLGFDGPVEHPPAVEEMVDACGLRNLPDGADAFAGALRLNSLILERFTYAPRSTHVHTKISEVFEIGMGVCQDFAHIFIAVCRAAGLPARYVSGYLVTRRSRSPQGSSASHAWAEVLLPQRGWCAFDPTNRLLANDFYIKLASGRNYRDVSPLHGTYRGRRVASHLHVRVHTIVHDENVGSVLDAQRELIG